MLKHFFLQSWVCLLIPPNPPWEESVLSVGGLSDWWMALWRHLEQHISFDKEITWPEKRGDGARVPFTREPEFVIPTARFNIHAFVYLYLNADTLKYCRVAMHHCSCVWERERDQRETHRGTFVSAGPAQQCVCVCVCLCFCAHIWHAAQWINKSVYAYIVYEWERADLFPWCPAGCKSWG